MAQYVSYDQITRRVREAPNQTASLWGAVLYIRNVDSTRPTRRVIPQLFTVTLEEVNRIHYRQTVIRILDSKNNYVDREGNAYGSELYFFDTEQEAIEYYNGKVDDALLRTRRFIEYLQTKTTDWERYRIEIRRT